MEKKIAIEKIDSENYKMIIKINDTFLNTVILSKSELQQAYFDIGVIVNGV